MADSDKVIAYEELNGQGTLHFGNFRIDYDDGRDITEISGLAEDADIEAYYGGRIHNPPEGYEGHEAKAGFRRKVVVENASARSTVINDLDSAGVAHSAPENVAPTQDEEDAIRVYGAYNGILAAQAMRFLRGVEDLNNGQITEKDYRLGRNPNRGERIPKDLPSKPDGMKN